MPTIAKIIGASMPTDRIIDGRDIWPLMHGDAGAQSPHEAFFDYWGHSLQAVEYGRWKLHFSHDYLHVAVPGHGGAPGKTETDHLEASLFDLQSDPGETTDVATAHPDIVAHLKALAAQCREDLGDEKTGQKGKNVREPGRVANATTTPSTAASANRQ